MEIEPGHEGHSHPPIFRPIGGVAPPEPVPGAAGDAHAVHFKAKGLEAPKTPQHLTYAGPTEQGEVELRGGTVTNADDPFANVGRNDKCPCGSGRKYKLCHGKAGGAGPTGQAVRGG